MQADARAAHPPPAAAGPRQRPGTPACLTPRRSFHCTDLASSALAPRPPQDYGLLWKHVEYRNAHSESRRSRRLVISSIATVVNYEYCFYWYLYQVGGA